MGSRRSVFVRRTAAVAVTAMAVVSCARGGIPGGAVPAGEAGPGAGAAQSGTLTIPPLSPPRVVMPGEGPTEPGLELRLRSAPAGTGPEVPDSPAAALSVPLSAERAAALLSRLAPLPAAGPEPFRFPAASPPPPRTGRVQLATFPPPDSVAAPTRPAPVQQALRVVRITPEGEALLAPHLTITFSEPMVPLSTVAEAEARTPPVRLSPQPPGRWTWVDPRTLRFVPEDGRFPMATAFTVDVPAGTSSAGGIALPESVRSTFATPAPRAVGAWPAQHPDDRGPQPGWPGRDGGSGTSVVLDPVVLIAFDQPVDDATVLATTRLFANGSRRDIRPARPDEVAADTLASLLVASLEPGHWVALRPVQPLPTAADVRVVVERGTSGAEGPIPTAQPQELRFRTYGALRIASHGCWRDPCAPGLPWHIQLTNPVAPGTPADGVVSVEPDLKDMAVHVAGSEIRITGDARPNARYRVTMSAGLRDRFGQALAGGRTVTFDIGPAAPAVAISGGPLIVLDPDGPPRVAVHTRSVSSFRVRVFQVTPQQWTAWARALDQWRQSRGGPLTPPGELVLTRTIEPAGGGDFAETHIDVAAALVDGLGHAIVVVEPAGLPLPGPDQAGVRPVAFAWVQSTRMGLAAAADGEDIWAWAASLRSGDPVAGAEVMTLPGGQRAVTAADGTARLQLGADGEQALVARLGADAALLPAREHPTTRGVWMHRPLRPELRWYVVTDRGLYLPGESVHVKGWLRRLPGGRTVDPVLPAGVGSIAFRMTGPRQEEIVTTELSPVGLGGFHTVVQLPEVVNLGQAGMQFQATGADEDAGNQHWQAVSIQEFRRPDYEVGIEADPGPHVVGDVIDVALQASYYGGGGLGGADLEWRVRTSPGRYAPPGWGRWHFGRAPWWGYRGPSGGAEHTLRGETDGSGRHRLLVDLLSVDPPFVTAVRAEAQVHDLTRQVGSAGVDLLVHPAAVSVGLRATAAWLRPGEPAEVAVVVVDHDGLPVAGRAVDLALTRMSGSWWMDPGSADTLPARPVCSLVSAAEPVTCRFSADSAGLHRLRADVRDDAGRSSRTELTMHVAGVGGPPDPRNEPGRFEVVADRDEYQPGDTARLLVQAPFHPAEALVTVRGAGLLSSEKVRLADPGQALLVPVSEAHLGGVTVRVDLVDAADGTGYGAGEVSLNVPPRRRELDLAVTPADSVAAPGGRTRIDVQVTDADGRPVPNAEVALWMVDEAVLALDDYTLRDPLSVFYAPRHQWVEDQNSRRWVVHWPRSAGPGTLSGVLLGEVGRVLAGATVRVVGTDATAVTAFDGSFTLRGLPPGEYVLEVTGPDGQMARRTVVVPAEGVHAGNLVLGSAGLMGEELSMAGGAERAAVAAAPPPPPPPPGEARLELQSLVVTGAGVEPDLDVRSDFSALAVFEPSLRTDATGRTQVEVTLPASLTRYRVMAVAVAGGDRFGTGEAAVTARKDLMVRVLAPRFLNRGDRFELPVLVQNSSRQPVTVEVAARAAGMEIHGPAGRQVTLPAGGRAEVRFDASASQPGTAHVQVAAVAGAFSDATAAVLPVLTPVTQEAFALHGSIDDASPVVLPLARPQGVIEEFGGVEVSLASTALQSLTDAVLYLRTYPFHGSEHLASRILAVAALRDFLSAFSAEGLPAPDSLVAVTQRDIAELVARQSGDGGWPFWWAGGPSHPFVSLHAVHALERARSNGFDVPPAALDAAQRYLQRIEEHTARWSLPARQGVAAYALYVRHRLGDPAAVAEARRMVQAPVTQVGGELPVEAAGWLLYVLAEDAPVRDALRRTLLNRLVETAGTATFASRYEDGEHLLLHSRRRTDAVVLEALIATDADDDVVTKLAQSLLAHRVAGRWSGTQENAWVLLALDRYFRTYEATTPAFQAGVWLGERYAGGGEFRGRTTDATHVAVPMPELLRAPAPEAVAPVGVTPEARGPELLIARTGEGRMYYRAALRYAPADPRVPSTDRGFAVTRRYEAVDDPDDVHLDADGTWRIRAGARVRVTLTMVAPSVRYHVALVDPLPAGFEPLNPELQGTGFTDAPEAPPVRPGTPARPGTTPPPPPPGGRLPAGASPPPPGFWQPTWFEHQNLRDDRAEAFASLLQAGVWEYSYLARATTPGTFIAPPPRAEMMYEPETFGRGAGEVVVVSETGR